MRLPDSENPESLGAAPTTVAFEEVYLALRQGTADGQENLIPTIAGDGFDEVRSHVSLTGHRSGPQMVVASGENWEGVSAEQQ